MERLTEREAFDAMALFLEKFYATTDSDDVGALLGSMMVLEDGGTADPAVWGEWVNCVNEVLRSSRG
jgi:hypothetical protein